MIDYLASVNQGSELFFSYVDSVSCNMYFPEDKCLATLLINSLLSFETQIFIPITM